jgi:hypothetical protein
MNEMSDIFHESSNLNEAINQCYICLDNEEGQQLVNPCSHCKVLAHIYCITKQIENGIDTCGQCNSPLQYEIRQKFNWNVMKNVLIIMYILLQITGYSMLMFGKDIVKKHDYNMLPMIIIIVVMINSLFIIGGCIGYFTYRNQLNINDWSILKLIIANLLLIIAISLCIILIHAIGYTNLLLRGLDIDFFTFTTFSTGLVTFGSIIIIFIGLILVIWICVAVVILILDKFKKWCIVSEINLIIRQ